MKAQDISLNKKINARGTHEQEKQYLFPDLYGHKSVTRNTKGFYKWFERWLKREEKSLHRLRFTTFKQETLP